MKNCNESTAANRKLAVCYKKLVDLFDIMRQEGFSLTVNQEVILSNEEGPLAKTTLTLQDEKGRKDLEILTTYECSPSESHVVSVDLSQWDHFEMGLLHFYWYRNYFGNAPEKNEYPDMTMREIFDQINPCGFSDTLIDHIDRYPYYENYLSEKGGK